MSLKEEIVNGVTIVNLIGQVDSVSAADLEIRMTGLLEEGAREVLFDCEELNYINSAGLRVFLIVGKRLEQDGGLLAFCGLSPNVRLIFETIGFDRILTLYPDRETALAGMNLAATKTT